jgi:branched-subunit amino acid transport protein
VRIRQRAPSVLAALPYKLGLAAVLVAWQTRNVLATIGAGMAALHLFKLVF